MKVSELISILQQHDPEAVVVVSMCPSEDSGDTDAITLERSYITDAQLRAVDDEEYRKRYTVVLENGIPGVWLL